MAFIMGFFYYLIKINNFSLLWHCVC